MLLPNQKCLDCTKITNIKILRIKNRDDRKRKGDKIGMGYKALHIIMELFTVQCLQVDDAIPILSPLFVVVAATVNLTWYGLWFLECFVFGGHDSGLHSLVLING